jgi:hypothetical protein
MNKLWHERNKMPAKATLEQRIAWHREHQKHCSCREAPKNIQAEIMKRQSAERRAARSPHYGNS